jgi:peroxiredoxin
MPRLLVAALTLVVVGGLAYVATRPLGRGEARPSFFPLGSAGPGLEVGQLAPGTAQAGSPSLGLVGLDGQPVSLAAFDGRPIWIIFWKTACEPCEAEAADVAAGFAAHRTEGLAVIGIDVWDSAAAVQDYVAEHALAIPIAIASDTTAVDAFGVWGAPTHYFIGRDGRIRDRYFGPLTRDRIDEALREIL